MNCISFSLQSVSDDVFGYFLLFITGDEVKQMCVALPWFLERMKKMKDWNKDYVLEIQANILEETAAFFLLHEIHWKQTVTTELGIRTYLNGVLHSFKDQPSVGETTPSGTNYKKWHKNGRLHRDPKLPGDVRLPAYVQYNGRVRFYYYEGGLYHISGIPFKRIHPRNQAEINETRAILNELGLLHTYMRF